MTLWTHAVMWLTYKRLSPVLKPTLIIYITRPKAVYRSLSLLLHIQPIPKNWEDISVCQTNVEIKWLVSLMFKSR